ncbi:hypothetical protein V5F59_22230 [Xanthobacter autotrophicus DSM 431]|uniref:hypothetical protein n=1 Tax=Xanthobacter nonsaccharivorans TaxID=3119912 RepID=UPI00372B7D77
MAYEFDGGIPPSRRAAARGIAANDSVARHSAAAALVLAFACAMSGLLMGLCLAGAHWSALSFVAGAGLAGIGTWLARDLIAALRD